MQINPASKAPVLAVFAASALFGAIWSVAAGQDVNWDWQNYHDYGVWALFNDRHTIDVAPASLQTYFNPGILLFDYALRNFLPMPLGTIITGAIQATSIAVIWCIAARICRHPAAVAAATLMAASAPMLLSELGTSFTDAVSAIPLLAGFLLLVSKAPERPVIVLAAGFLFGAMAGLKPTNAVYGAGALATVLVCSTGRVRTVLWLGIGGATGALLAGGP